MKIIGTDGKVTIDGFEFYGEIHEDTFCSTCQAHLVFYDAYDALFCASCNEWKESACQDPHCMYCPKRPEQPLASK